MIQNSLALRIIVSIFFSANQLVVFSQPLDISTGLLPLRVDGKWGYINQSGEIVITPQYESVSMNVYANTPIVKKDGVYFLVDSLGNRIDENDYLSLSFYGNGSIVAARGKTWGCINFKGQETIPFIFDEINGFIDGYSIAKKDSSIGVIDTLGEFIILDRFVSLENASEGFIRTSSIQKETGRILYGLYDVAEKRTIVEPVLISLSYVKNGKAVYSKLNGETGLMDCETGKFQSLKYDVIICDPDQNYKQMNDDHSDSLFIVGTKEKYGLIDLEGREILKPKFRSDIVPYLTHGFIAYCNNGECGLVDTNGKIKTFSNTDYIREVQHSLMIANQDGLFGVISFSEEVILPFLYSNISFLSNDIIVLFTGGNNIYDTSTQTKMGYANSNGKIIREPSN